MKKYIKINYIRNKNSGLIADQKERKKNEIVIISGDVSRDIILKKHAWINNPPMYTFSNYDIIAECEDGLYEDIYGDFLMGSSSYIKTIIPQDEELNAKLVFKLRQTPVDYDLFKELPIKLFNSDLSISGITNFKNYCKKIKKIIKKDNNILFFGSIDIDYKKRNLGFRSSFASIDETMEKAREKILSEEIGHKINQSCSHNSEIVIFENLIMTPHGLFHTQFSDDTKCGVNNYFLY